MYVSHSSATSRQYFEVHGYDIFQVVGCHCCFSGVVENSVVVVVNATCNFVHLYLTWRNLREVSSTYSRHIIICHVSRLFIPPLSHRWLSETLRRPMNTLRRMRHAGGAVRSPARAPPRAGHRRARTHKGYAPPVTYAHRDLGM